MTRVLLSGGAYQSRSIISGATRSVNLFPERNPSEDEPPVPVTQYPTPGLVRNYSHPGGGSVRIIYQASSSKLYTVIGGDVLLLDPTTTPWTGTSIGSIAPGANPVSMADNGVKLILVDGSANGWTIDLATQAFAPIVAAGFYGADSVLYVDTYFVLNKKGTQQFYISDSLATTFNVLNFASKVGFSDVLVTIIMVRREIWLIGKRTTEIWVSSGAPDFPFTIMSGAFIEHGCAAIYSVSKIDTTPFWLSQDKAGNCMVLRGEGYKAMRVSNHAIEYAWSNYTNVSDAFAFCYQIAGHSFYVLTFPTADATWVYDIATGQWHEWAWMDGAGALHQARCECAASIGFVGEVFAGDRQNGAIYRLDLTVGTDDGQPIKRIRSFPHMVNDGNRQFFESFIVDMDTGNAPPGAAAPVLTLKFSDDHGHTWSTPVLGDFGRPGQYNESIQFNRLGMGRDRIFSIEWDSPVFTALNGAWVTTRVSSS